LVDALAPQPEEHVACTPRVIAMREYLRRRFGLSGGRHCLRPIPPTQEGFIIDQIIFGSRGNFFVAVLLPLIRRDCSATLKTRYDIFTEIKRLHRNKGGDFDCAHSGEFKIASTPLS
jgi:hypothetical protein